MKRPEKIQQIRALLRDGKPSIGSWIQIPHASVAEIMGGAGYDWVAVDLEHGSIAAHQLPDLFRALELGGTLPMARLAQGLPKDCKQALDAGAGGVIVPMIESAAQLSSVCDACRWPPAGTRGVGFSRANLFGKRFDDYSHEAQSPLIIAMIEHVRAVNNLDEIVKVPGLDAVLIGPYDLSSSMGITAQFDHPDFEKAMQQIQAIAKKHSMAAGIHVVDPSPDQVQARIVQGYTFLAYSIDSVLLGRAATRPM